jgi:hypothetical protein
LNLLISMAFHGGLDFSAFSLDNCRTALTIVDSSLAVVLAVLGSFYIKNRGKVIQSRTESVSPFLTILERVKAGLSGGLFKETVLREFPKILDAATEIGGMNADPSFTAYEVIGHGLASIPGQAREVLMSLYQLYEPLRFGNMPPSPDKGPKFVEALEKLQGIMVRSEMMTA